MKSKSRSYENLSGEGMEELLFKSQDGTCYGFAGVMKTRRGGVGGGIMLYVETRYPYK